MQASVGPERIILTDGLQPFMFRTSKGTLFCQAQLSFPPGYERPAKNAFPGLPGNLVSRDGGKTWTRWFPAKDQGLGPTIEGAATELADGTVLVLDWVAEGPDEHKVFRGRLWESRDDLQTVQGPTPFTVHVPRGKAGFDDGGHPYYALTFHRSLLQLPAGGASKGGGDLLACVYGWLEGDDAPVGYQPRMLKFRCMLVRSADRGRTWSFVSTILPPLEQGEEGADEPVMVRLSRGPHAGRLVCLARTGSADFPIYQATSDDEGETWSPPRELPFRGVDPDLVEAADAPGMLVGIVGRRKWDDPSRKYYQIVASPDAGETWRVLAAWGLPPHAAADSLTSYAGIREIEPGRFLAVYDIGGWSLPVRYVASRVVTVQR